MRRERITDLVLVQKDDDDYGVVLILGLLRGI
jgi:hypothetical protein